MALLEVRLHGNLIFIISQYYSNFIIFYAGNGGYVAVLLRLFFLDWIKAEE